MDIVRHEDGSLTVPVVPSRHAHDDDVETGTGEGAGQAAGAGEAQDPATSPDPDAGTDVRVLRPGEGGYTDALAAWDAQQHPDRGEAVSTVSGREGAMAVVHAVAEDRKHVPEAVAALDDAAASGDALRHVLVGGTPSVQAFSSEVAEAEGGDELPAHTATKIIGEVLAEIDSHEG